MSIFFYQVGLWIYTLSIRIAAIFGSTKAQLWLKGRQDIFAKIQAAFAANTQPIIWLHCASLGEFEQGRPILEAFKKQAPQYKILLTFFSPSGYEIQKNYAHADWVFYLPMDSPFNAAKFLQITQPAMAIFVKYEFWYFYLSQLQKNKIPTYLVSAIFRPQQVFFKWYGGIFRQMIFCFKHIFVQDAGSVELLQKIGFKAVTVAGDTRTDRVLAIKAQAKKYPIVEMFCANYPVLVAGSTWLADEVVLAGFLKQYSNYKIILAPHQIDETHLLQIEEKFAFTSVLRYSKCNENSALQTAKVLIIDNFGMLSSLYGYGQIAYIGGGFGAGIHNSLEAAVYEIPVLFGSNYQKFKEAKDLIQEGIAFEIKNAKDIEKAIVVIQEKSDLIASSTRAYISKNQNATQIVMSHIL